MQEQDFLNNTPDDEKDIFEPIEVMAIAIRGAETFLSENPKVSEEKKKLLRKMIADDRQRKEEELKKVNRRYAIALNQAKIFQARNADDDYEIILDYQAPTVDEPGFVKLQAEDMTFRDEKMLKAIAGASSVSFNVIERAFDDGFCWWAELVMQFKV